MGSVGEEGERIEQDHVDGAVGGIRTRHDDDDHHDELGVRDQQPGHDGADDAANVLRNLNINCIFVALQHL